MSSSSSLEIITLIVEGNRIPCDKKVLVDNSDYFKRILGSHGFAESGSKELEVKDVEYKVMDIILRLIWDYSYMVDVENILLVLQALDMLQFRDILQNCIIQATELISVTTCVNIWLMTEHIHCSISNTPIYLKAKSFALREFDAIKELTCLLELNLQQLCSYLSNTQLYCNKEIDVFQTCMKWWYENCKNIDKSLKSATNNFICMLFCIDFSALSAADINEMMSYPDICDNKSVTNCLKCVLDLRNEKSANAYSEQTVQMAKELLASRKRFRQTEPYLIMNIVELGKRHDGEYVLIDKYKRKRRLLYRPVSNCMNDDDSKVVPIKSMVYYDLEQNCFEHFMELPTNKTNLLEGCQIVGYKELIFLFGGESALGRGNWNLDFWVYDTIRETWQRKTKLPSGRRHFQCCVIDSRVFIVGGTGCYRVLKNDLIFYDYKTDVWSKTIELPVNSSWLKCCNFNGKLLLCDATIKTSFIFNEESFTFVKVPFTVELPSNISIYSIGHKLFVKGISLKEFELCNGHFALKNVVYHQNKFAEQCDQMHSVLCFNYLFTVYKDGNNITMEKFDVTNHKTTYLIEDFNCEEEFQINGETFHFRNTDLFAFSRFDLFKENSYVNDFRKYMNMSLHELMN